MAWYDGLNDRMNAIAGEQEAARTAAATEAERIAKIRAAGLASGAASEAARTAAASTTEADRIARIRAAGAASGAASEAARTASAIETESIAGGTPTTTTNPLQQSTDDLNAAISDFSKINTNVSADPIRNVNTDLSKSIEGITQAGATGITASKLGEVSSLRPDNPYMGSVDTALSQLKDYSTGDSQADRTAANLMLSRLDASTAAANMAQAQRIAANPNLTEGAKQAAIAEMNRTAGAQRSEVVGQLAQQAQERAFQATQKMADVAQVAANFKEGQFEFDVKTAGEDLARNLTAQIKAGEMTESQAQLELSKAAQEISVATQNRTAELDKYAKIIDANIAKASNATNRESLRLDQERIDNDKIRLAQETQSYMGATAANMIMSMYDDNATLSSTDVMNNRASMQAMTNYHQSIPGNEGTVPDEDDIATYMSQMKPEWKVAKESLERNLADLKSTLTASGADTETIDFVSSYINLIDQSGGAISMNPDGSMFISGADGRPITYTDEYGNEVEMIFGDTGAKGSSIVSSILTTVPEKNFNELIAGVNAGDYSDVDEFSFYLKQSAKDAGKTLNISDAEIEKIYNDATTGKLRPGELDAAEDTGKVDYRTAMPTLENIWSTTNKKILSNPSNENFDLALQYVVDDAVNGNGKANLINLVNNNPRLKEELMNRGRANEGLSDSAKNPGDLIIDENGNLRMIVSQDGGATNSFIVVKSEQGAGTDNTTENKATVMDAIASPIRNMVDVASVPVRTTIDTARPVLSTVQAPARAAINVLPIPSVTNSITDSMTGTASGAVDLLRKVLPF